jgi:chondroitin AC lyase
MEQIPAWLRALRSDGSWTDIDYADRTGMSWQPFQHARRVHILAAAYVREQGAFAGDAKVRQAIASALRYWSTQGPICPNWWHNEIGVPNATSGALLLLKDELTPEEREMARRFATRKTINRAGQNGVWNAEVDLLCALILEDEPLASRSINAIFEHVAAPRFEGRWFSSCRLRRAS